MDPLQSAPNWLRSLPVSDHDHCISAKSEPNNLRTNAIAAPHRALGETEIEKAKETRVVAQATWSSCADIRSDSGLSSFITENTENTISAQIQFCEES